MLSKLVSATVLRRAHHLQSSALFILTTLNGQGRVTPFTAVKVPKALQHTYIFMFEETQHLQFSEYPLARNKVLEDIGHLFEGNSLSISGICY